MTKFKYWLPPLIWAGVVFLFSSLKVTPTTQVYWQDFVVKKAAHIFEYSVLFVLTYRALLNTTHEERRKIFTWTFLITIIYAISDEYHQSFTPGREPTLRDILIDSTAAIISWIGIWKYLPKAPKKLKSLAKALQIS